MDTSRGGFQNLHIRLLNGRVFQKLLKNEKNAQYKSEQGKILSVLWNSKDGMATGTDISVQTGLANNTLTAMIKKLVEQGLVTLRPCPNDQRKKYVQLTELGWSQKEIGDRLSQELAEIFYKGFTSEEIASFEAYQERIIANLKQAELELNQKDNKLSKGV